MYGIELIIIIFSTLALALAGGGPSLSIFGVMIFWRVILGTGIGGDYPLSSIITSEFATVKWRGAMMAALLIGDLAAGRGYSLHGRGARWLARCCATCA